MILKGNMLKLTIPFFWAVQSLWLLSFKSIETFIAAIILLLISFLGIVIKNPLNWGRNIETIIGNRVAGKGQAYEINIYGSAKLTPFLPWIK